MKRTIPLLFAVSTLAAGLGAQSTVQSSAKPSEERSWSGPADVSLAGYDGNARRDELGLYLPPSIGMVVELFCFPRIEDQATAGCLMATSVPTPGMLFPPPHSGGTNNQVSTVTSHVGGGENNLASAPEATVSGGNGNTASGNYAAVGGGYDNTASGYASVVNGGTGNDATTYRATVVGGRDNLASGNIATVLGGRDNVASGALSFAAGRRALAVHFGAIVFGDGQDFDKSSSNADEFSVFCAGGARFLSNAAQTTGVGLAPGGGSWTNISDRAAKENFEPVDGREVLERLAEVPLTTWNYKAQNESIRHMGPMAQDFYAAFGLGLGEKSIDTIDPDGVALAAIQGLHDLVQEKDAEIDELRARQATLEAHLAELLRRMDE